MTLPLAQPTIEPLTVDDDGAVSGMLHPAEFIRYRKKDPGENPLTGQRNPEMISNDEWEVASCVRLPTNPDVFMRAGFGRIQYGVHPKLSAKPREVIAYYDGVLIPRPMDVVRVDEVWFDDDGCHVHGRLWETPGWDDGRLLVEKGSPSCDWRTIDGQFTLVGCLIMYVPGFEIPS